MVVVMIHTPLLGGATYSPAFSHLSKHFYIRYHQAKFQLHPIRAWPKKIPKVYFNSYGWFVEVSSFKFSNSKKIFRRVANQATLNLINKVRSRLLMKNRNWQYKRTLTSIVVTNREWWCLDSTSKDLWCGATYLSHTCSRERGGGAAQHEVGWVWKSGTTVLHHQRYTQLREMGNIKTFVSEVLSKYSSGSKST